MTDQPNVQHARSSTLVAPVFPAKTIPECSSTARTCRAGGEHARQITIETARELGSGALELVMKAPTDPADAERYFIEILREALAEEGSGNKKKTERAQDALLEHHSKMGGIAVFGLYQLSPWASSRHEDFHRWAASAKLDAPEIAFALSFVREFEAWEPATAQDYALIIKLDRAVIRGARVGASALVEEAFERWLENNQELVEGGATTLTKVRQLVRAGSDGVRAQLEAIARTMLRDIGRKYGRSGLNSVRRQIGAPPSARRRSHLGIGAQFSAEVYALTEQYQRLKPGEREAFKSLLLKIDAAAPQFRK